MARFLTTSATNYILEELIKTARDRLILISPFLKLNDRIRELPCTIPGRRQRSCARPAERIRDRCPGIVQSHTADKNRLKIDVRIVYGKSELQPEEINWLKELTYLRTSFCKNLHAKCYLNEDLCIITSLNLYEFSQINNNEMGVLINRSQDPELYKDAAEEAQRLIRISEEVRISLERVAQPAETKDAKEPKPDDVEPPEKLTSSKLAQKLGIKTAEFLDRLVASGHLELREGKHYLTQKGKDAGGEFRMSPKFGPFFLWPEGTTA